MVEVEKWYLWRDIDRSPYLNMSIDELLLSSAGLDRPLIRIYGWDRPSVSIGYVQSYAAAPHDKYTIVRRPTGGGIVYHDHDLTYTAIVPNGHAICDLNRMDSYHVFHRAVQAALETCGISAALSSQESAPVDRATMQCFVTPTRYDVVGDGKKYAGAAQRRTRDGILHQGSIELSALGCDPASMAEKLLTALEKQFKMQFIEFKVPASFMELAENLATEKYATENWNQHKKS